MAQACAGGETFINQDNPVIEMELPDKMPFLSDFHEFMQGGGLTMCGNRIGSCTPEGCLSIEFLPKNHPKNKKAPMPFAGLGAFFFPLCAYLSRHRTRRVSISYPKGTPLGLTLLLIGRRS